MNDIISELRDMRYLNWAKTRRSSGTAGSFLKAYDDTDKKKKYYKLSDYDPSKGIIGHECVNEIIVQRLLDILNINHLEYTLLHALVSIDGKSYETWLCESEDYKSENESKLALDEYYQIEREGDESPLDLCRRKGWERYVYEMFLIDYLVLNRDRHGANTEVLRDSKKHRDRLAPLFDHGLSLTCRCHTIDELKSFNVMEDKRVQSFLGTESTLENIRSVPKNFLTSLPRLTKDDLSSISAGLEDIIGKCHILKINEMIWERWNSLGHI